MKISVIGTGRMGVALVKRLNALGFRVYTWNRNREKLLNLPAVGLQTLKDIKGDAIAILVSDNPAVEYLLKNGLLEADLQDKPVMLMGTYTPEYMAEVYEQLKAKGAFVLCSPILSNPSTLEAGKAYCIVGGDEEGYEKARWFYDAIGSSTYLGSVEKAAAAKLVFNGLLLSFVALLGEVAGIAKSYGVQLEDLMKILENTMFSGLAVRFLNKMMMVKEASFTLSLAKKDLTYAVRAAEQTKTPVQILSASKSLFELLERLGLGEEDYSKAGAFESRLIEI